jgi:orotidine-5'-phosphate decarboxylase
MRLFSSKHGLIPACDVSSIIELQKLIEDTSALNFIQAYKIGIELLIPYGVKSVVDKIRSITNTLIIYDHQKYGNDIPVISGGKFLDILKEGGVNAIIIFPFAGIETLTATIEKCKQIDLLPIVGGEMTHGGFLESDGGYLSDNAPTKIYEDAAKLGVNHFVVPGTKIGKIKQHVESIAKIIHNPTFMFPGIGKGQGGDIAEAFKASLPYNSYAIVGRGIYAAENSTEAAKTLWENASSVL